MSEPNEFILYTTADGELEREATVALFATVQIEGSREVERRIEREAVVANHATTAADGKICRVDSYSNGVKGDSPRQHLGLRFPQMNSALKEPKKGGGE